MRRVVLFVAIFMLACQASPLEADDRYKRQVEDKSLLYGSRRSIHNGRQGCPGGNCPEYNRRDYSNYNGCSGGNCQTGFVTGDREGSSINGLLNPRRFLGFIVNKKLTVPRISFIRTRTCYIGTNCGYRMQGYQQRIYPQRRMNSVMPTCSGGNCRAARSDPQALENSLPVSN